MEKIIITAALTGFQITKKQTQYIRLAREIGKDVATVEEARQILDII